MFGNKVKIKSSPETIEKGLAGKTGVVYGETTPSMMDFDIIGTPNEDYALNVHFEDLNEGYWFDPELIEHLDNGEGTVITLEGVDKKWTKGSGGEWMEEDTTAPQNDSKSTEKESLPRKKWWHFNKK